MPRVSGRSSARCPPANSSTLRARQQVSASSWISVTVTGRSGCAHWSPRSTNADLHVVGRLMTREELLRCLRVRLLLGEARRRGSVDSGRSDHCADRDHRALHDRARRSCSSCSHSTPACAHRSRLTCCIRCAEASRRRSPRMSRGRAGVLGRRAAGVREHSRASFRSARRGHHDLRTLVRRIALVDGARRPGCMDAGSGMRFRISRAAFAGGPTSVDRRGSGC